MIYFYNEYDKFGNLIFERYSGSSIDKSYKYDAQNQLIEYVNHNIPYPFHEKIEYSYDENGDVSEKKFCLDGKLQNITKYVSLNNINYIYVYFKKLKKKPDEIYIVKYDYW